MKLSDSAANHIIRRFGILSVTSGLLTCLALADVPITTLYSTGIGPGGPLADGDVDSYYLLSTADTTAGIELPDSWVVDEGVYPLNGTWTPDDSNSKWIGPVANESVPPWTNQDTDYNYIYTTTFNLSGMIPDTAEITGQFETDNQMLEVILNGSVTGIQNLDTGGFTYWTPFTITSGFQPGINTLTFVTHNYSDGQVGYISGPTGLRVEMSGTAEAVPSPAAATTALIGILGIARRRKVKR